MIDGTTIDRPIHSSSLDSGVGVRGVLALVIAWSRDEPHRIGEVAFVDGDHGDHIFGRGAGLPDDDAPRLTF